MRKMQFFGVRTAGSSALKIFPSWAEVLGLQGASLVGVDLPLDASDQQYREAVAALRRDPGVAGALVTSHKLNVVRAAGDLFDGFTEKATRGGEVSAIYKREGKLWGHAVDPQTCGAVLDAWLKPSYWATHAEAEILCLGAGGAATALVVHLLTRAKHLPRQITLVDVKAAQLEHIRHLLSPFGRQQERFKLVLQAEPAANDTLVASLPSHSLVINATGMGKDLPGSPLTDGVVFPEAGAVWELNYRGERTFLKQAQQQAGTRALRIEDGWRYFLLGWSQVISHVYGFDLTPAQFEAFASVSAQVRDGSS